MRSNFLGFAVFLASISSSNAELKWDVIPNVTLVETTRRSMGMGLMLPEGSPWCPNGAPAYWFMGHALPEHIQCETSPGEFERVRLDLDPFDRHGCTAFDVNQDGVLDIICTIGGKQGTATEKSNEVYLTQPNGTLVKISNHGMESPTRRSKDFITFQDKDGVDLIFEAVHATVRKDGQINDNQLYRRIANRNLNGGPYFRAVEGPWDNTTFYPLTVIPGRFNKDAATDLFMIGRELPKAFYTMRVYKQRKNHPGKFMDMNVQERWKQNYRWQAGTAADIDGDGLMDMVGFDTIKGRFFVFYNSSFKGRLRFIRGILPHRIPYQNATYGIHVRDIQVFDANGDGLMDIYVSQSVNDKGKYCYYRPPGGFNRIVKDWNITKNPWWKMFEYEPPEDPVPDLLFIQKPKNPSGKPKYPRFVRHNIPLNLHGCAGRMLPYGDQKIALAYNYGQWPGYQYLLDWSNNGMVEV